MRSRSDRFAVDLRGAQRGAVLVVSLILLLVMTILAISGSQVVRMQERMAGNLRDVGLAFQSAEAGLRDGEQYIEGLTAWPSACTTLASGCNMYETTALLDQDLRVVNGVFWSDYAREYRVDGTNDMGAEVVDDSDYVIEKLDAVCDTSEGPCTESDTLYYFRVTARANGGTGTSDARLQSTYVRRGIN